MQHTVTINGKEHTLLLGYAILKEIGKMSSKKGSAEELDFEDFEQLTLEAIKIHDKTMGKDTELTRKEIEQAFMDDIDLQAEVQVCFEVFMQTHSERRQKFFKVFKKEKEKK